MKDINPNIERIETFRALVDFHVLTAAEYLNIIRKLQEEQEVITQQMEKE